MNADHVPVGSGGNDRGLKVIANSFPDTSKGQRQAIHPLKVKGLTVAGSPLVEATGRDKASVVTECIAEAREGVHGFCPSIEKRTPARGGEPPDGGEHVPASRGIPYDRNSGAGSHVVAFRPGLLAGYNSKYLGNLLGFPFSDESAAHKSILAVGRAESDKKIF